VRPFGCRLLALQSPHAASSQAGGLLLCATSRDNLSPSLVLELLLRIGRVIKACQTQTESLRLVLTTPDEQDYCGVLSEESVRRNFVLVYELLDEVIDYGRASLALMPDASAALRCTAPRLTRTLAATGRTRARRR